MVIAYDLGTGGLKASLHGPDGRMTAETFVSYDTYYPRPGWQEQRPMDWWEAVCASTRTLLERSATPPERIAAVALSGQSIAPVLLDRAGELVLDQIPIWSDTRATTEAAEFFAKIPNEDWYMTTGNGDPPETYTVMKLIWLQRHRPDAWRRVSAVVGSKDFINHRLTGAVATDYSYASGSGVFDLKALRYREEYIHASGIPPELFPQVCDSHQVVGRVTKAAAAESGLPEGIPVACGGVDNACMALGALGIGEGRVYTSLGSSAWIAVTSRTPTLDPVSRPFIFAHVEKGFYTSGVSVFAAGSAYRWAAEQLCGDLPEGGARFAAMDALAASSTTGAGGVLFNPSLAGGSSQEPGSALSGAFLGLSLGSTRGDMLRAVLEGVALSLGRYCLETLGRCTPLAGEMLLCGGGAKSPLWNQIFADVFGMEIVRGGIGQNAASLGAAAIAARAAGLWPDYTPLDGLYPPAEVFRPDPDKTAFYRSLGDVFLQWTGAILPASERLRDISQNGGNKL